ncbi:hypothetical protein [Henriciella marina]|uniref:hypothetical protein n=1 Tax=Henriciella marina TaxID=453851 RepID=UPI00037E2B80|nr:hypothetical protein [Henriciella marina]
MQAAVLRRIFRFGPLIFAVGFLTPLAAQLIKAAGATPPFGMSPLMTGFMLAMLIAIPAQIRGRWV